MPAKTEHRRRGANGDAGIGLTVIPGLILLAAAISLFGFLVDHADLLFFPARGAIEGTGLALLGLLGVVVAVALFITALRLCYQPVLSNRSRNPDSPERSLR